MDNNRILNEKWEFVNCNLCGSNNFDNVCTYNEIKIVKCKICGFIYRNPRLKEELNREFYSYKYYGEYEGMEERISSARYHLFKKVLSQLNKKIKCDSRRLLDFGCGQGHFLKLAKDLGWQVEGVELAKSACDYAKNKFGIEVINKSIEEANLKDNSFDVVTLWNVLDHLLDPLSALKEIKRILKPKGILVIRVPNVNFHLFLHRVFSLLPTDLKYKKFRDPSVIVNYGFSSKTLKKILEKTGFRNIQIYNSPLSFGDPYKSFNVLGSELINVLKICLNIFAQSILILSFGKLCISSSLLIYGKADKKGG